MSLNLAGKLHQYTQKDMKLCEESLGAADGNFWEALHGLCRPQWSKSEYLDQLVPLLTGLEENKEQCIQILREIYENHYLNMAYTNIIIEIICNDSDCSQAAGNPPKNRKHLPDPREPGIYLPLMESESLPLVEGALNIIGCLPFSDWSSRCREAVRSLLYGQNQFMSNAALKLSSDNPERATFYLNEILFNLNPRRDQCHFSALRIFWSDNVPEEPQILPLLEKIRPLHSAKSQVNSMIRDIRVRYAALSPREAEEQEKEQVEEEFLEARKYLEKMTADELHYFVSGYNWDDGIDYLKAAAEHKSCDLATAKMIYWRGKPLWFTQYESGDEVPAHEKDVYNLLILIEDKVKAKKYKKGKLSYSPKNDGGFDWTENQYVHEIKRKIPEAMYENQE